MPTVFLIHPDGRRQAVAAREGDSLMQAAVAAGVAEIAADCGGMLTCATCHVHVPPAWRDRLPPPSADEDSMLEMTASPRDDGSRLSCQLLITADLDGLEVSLPQTQY
jgi:2Fe-2S ferredoxin